MDIPCTSRAHTAGEHQPTATLSPATEELVVRLPGESSAHWVGVFDDSSLIALGEIDEGAGRRAFLYLPVDVDATRVRVVLAVRPAELAA